MPIVTGASPLGCLGFFPQQSSIMQKSNLEMSNDLKELDGIQYSKVRLTVGSVFLFIIFVLSAFCLHEGYLNGGDTMIPIAFLFFGSPLILCFLTYKRNNQFHLFQSLDNKLYVNYGLWRREFDFDSLEFSGPYRRSMMSVFLVKIHTGSSTQTVELPYGVLSTPSKIILKKFFERNR